MEGRALFQPVELVVKAGEWLHLQGMSGAGKSTFLRIIAGLWQDYRGTFSRPEDILFLPQKVYLPKDTLAKVLCYPKTQEQDAGVLSDVLTRVGLPQLISRLDSEKDWGQILSGGEQQRIAFARALLIRPGFICMDESTNQLVYYPHNICCNYCAGSCPDVR